MTPLFARAKLCHYSSKLTTVLAKIFDYREMRGASRATCPMRKGALNVSLALFTFLLCLCLCFPAHAGD
jgi:hypothetical protein